MGPLPFTAARNGGMLIVGTAARGSVGLFNHSLVALKYILIGIQLAPRFAVSGGVKCGSRGTAALTQDGVGVHKNNMDLDVCFW